MPIFLWCVHYIKIFLFMSSIHLCPLNSVWWKFLRFFLHLKFDESFCDFFFIWSLMYFSLEYLKTTRSWFCVFSRGKNFKVQIKKKSVKINFWSLFFSTGPIILAKGMIWYNVQLSKIFFLKTPAIWDTLLYIHR